MDNSGGSKGTIVTHYDATDFSAQMENSSGVVETTKAFYLGLEITLQVSQNTLEIKWE